MKKDTLSQLDKLIASVPNYGPPGENEFTTEDWMAKKGYPPNHAGQRRAQRELDAFVQSGQISLRKGMVKTRRGNIYAFTQK